MAGRKTPLWVLATGAVLALGACNGTNPFAGGESGTEVSDTAEATTAEAPAAGRRVVERDVEVPNVFSAAEAGLWDGRPSLGGVWVAYPGVRDPERVIIRNPANGKFVIGALFRREREMPGPRLQVSSDAASALGLLAGQPGRLEVTALRREEVAEEAPQPPATPVLDQAETITAETLDPPAASTGAPAPAAGAAAAPAVATAAATPPPARPAAAAAAAPKPPAQPRPAAAAKPAASGGRNLIQIGIFSVETNAKGAADRLRKDGAAVSIKREESQGKAYWRVLAGPAADGAGRDALLARVKAAGFKDAYFVAR